MAADTNSNPCDKLMDSLKLWFQSNSVSYEDTTLDKLTSEYQNARNKHGLAIKVFSLAQPTEAISLLQQMISDDSYGLAALEAAVVLAMLGNASAIDELRQPRGQTNSGIEYTYAKAGLALLGEAAPTEWPTYLHGADSHPLIEACLAEKQS